MAHRRGLSTRGRRAPVALGGGIDGFTGGQLSKLPRNARFPWQASDPKDVSALDLRADWDRAALRRGLQGGYAFPSHVSLVYQSAVGNLQSASHSYPGRRGDSAALG